MDTLSAIRDRIKFLIPDKSCLIDSRNNLSAQQASASSALYALLSPLFTRSGKVFIHPVTAWYSEGSRALPDAVYSTLGSTSREYRQIVISSAISFLLAIQAKTYRELVDLRDSIALLVNQTPNFEVVDANDDFEMNGQFYQFKMEIEVGSRLADILVLETEHKSLNRDDRIQCLNLPDQIQQHFAVVVMADSDRDTRALRDEVRTALVNWQVLPSCTLIKFDAGMALVADAGMSAWVDNFYFNYTSQ